MIHVYLDDFRACPPGFVLARNLEECLLLLQEYEVDVLSLDYDLGWGFPNGLEVVRAMISLRAYPKRIFLHTSSDAGRKHMYEMLYQQKPDHVALVNGPVPPELLMELAHPAKE
ncbi:cell division protein FtsJ [Paenibacillus validus]|uniref:Cell division protein FtsJ n=1 Tax=Paenibacillus validus TaxID=44253 RepID=A0A7X3CS43_9BACL|nr:MULTISPECIES: cyclic-phosphate processing receiver domain-containing protein [Paenibacillus]MED4602382.1 cell division protein FtsJ [Paenibacillus validus]MED4608907.1 cell division protein FtsJ [Paenibacillus validus]MUG69609.1 cell division protein FtsJ [Paenibacillus validus]